MYTLSLQDKQKNMVFVNKGVLLPIQKPYITAPFLAITHQNGGLY